MQFLTSLFGGSSNTILNAALALGIVLVLIVLGLWALKLLSKASSNVGRGRNRRLMIVDQLPLDTKRQLLIIRRDNVEHLILTGGPQDVVIETGIAVEHGSARSQPRRPAARSAAPAPSAPLQTPQRAPAPQRASTPDVILPLPTNDENVLRTPLDRLRDLGRSNGQRRPSSLRHTGLMRPVSRMEPGLIPANTDNSAHPRPDSARNGLVTSLNGMREGDGNGRAAGDDVNKSGLRE